MAGVKVIERVPEMQACSEAERLRGRKIGCVPTMGYLHEGHLSLLRECRRRSDVVVMTLFVNPTQFAPHEDLTRYPRDFEGDCRRAEAAGAEVVFAPSVAEMYPPGYQTYVTVEEVSKEMEGAFRPTHFRGVATVVTKLFAAVRPHLAIFGEKDYQQLKVIEQMTRDLNLGIEIIGCPTVRDEDGLALSSRNVYLSPAERERALALSRSLYAAAAAVKEGEQEPAALIASAQKTLLAAGLEIDYIEVRDAETLAPIGRIEKSARMLIAARVGSTRLIDNIALEPPGR